MRTKTRTWMAALLLGAVGVAHGQVTYRVVIKGEQTGQATLTQKLLDDGGKSVALSMTIRQGEKRVVVKTETTYGKDGSVVKSEQKIFPFGQPAVKDTVSVFDPGGVTVEEKIGDPPDAPVKVAAKSDQVRSNASTFWFTKITPNVGDACTAWIFNISTMKWEECTFTYEGKTHRGNLVRMERLGKSIETAFGDDGYPNSIEDGAGMQMTRV